MATGGLDVLRRESYSSFYPQKEEEVVPYKNSVRDAKFSHRGGSHVEREHEDRKISSSISTGARRGKLGSNDVPRGRNGEVSRREDVVQPPPEKKRKFSPIIWDLEEKFSSKNRLPVDNLPVHKSSAYSTSELSNVVADGDVKKAISESEVTEFALGKPGLLNGSIGTMASESPAGLQQEEHTEINCQDQVHLEEEEFVEAPNISTSRWASDSDSPRDQSFSYAEGTPEGREHGSKRSTPESGEFFRESSEEDGARVTGSDKIGSEDGSSENECEDSMDVDAKPDEAGGNYLHIVEPAQRSMLQCCRSVYEFEKLNKINEGTYGVVYRARDKKTGEIVALKKIKLNVGRKEDYLEYGFPITSLREINILLSFNHPSIVNVKEVVMDDHDGVFMVMEYMEHDLKGLMESMKQPFSTSEVKCLMLQLLEGIKYLHDNWVLHRDLKTSNLLVDNQGQLKLCDFGMSRQYGSPLKPYTALVVTLWYRAPELLLGSKKYSTALDMWSVGCIMAELLAKKPLFNGTNEVDQIDKIFRTLGTPNETIWPGFSELKGSKAKFVKQPYNLLRKRFPATSFTGSPVLSESGFDLLNKLLTYDPEKRITADDALNHDWFHEVPLPKSKEFMPTFPPQHARKRHVQSTREKTSQLSVSKCSVDDKQKLASIHSMPRIEVPVV